MSADQDTHCTHAERQAIVDAAQKWQAELLCIVDDARAAADFIADVDKRSGFAGVVRRAADALELLAS